LAQAILAEACLAEVLLKPFEESRTPCTKQLLEHFLCHGPQ